MQRSYDGGITDEFIEPICVEGAPRVEPGDTVIFFNFRPDRGRQLTRMLLDHGVDVTTMTRYSSDLDTPIAFAEQDIEGTLAQVLAEHDVRQLHVAETEKYAHVTYFFNGGREEEVEGEERALVESPRDVPTYDHKPEMSAEGAAEAFVSHWSEGNYRFGIINFANPDMVGHTGVIPAAVAAVETVDTQLGKVIEAVTAKGGACIVTADHGNCDHMLEPDGSPNTAHSLNPVPLIVTTKGVELRDGGILADVAPTALQLLGIPQPEPMTGRSLIESGNG
ncbi:MAG: 2,3-bisphosphoglycerate-independent phosphoglycerate mutase [Solirubrobacterales bacterium]|nr:2,3-bisphosphoglycerate-independent phosphoglycerate mutase [Solirubrobacterales bacterium]